MAAKKLTTNEQEELLKSFQRVLKRRGITAPLNVQFATPVAKATAAAATSKSDCVRWVCRTEGGRTVCGWEAC